MAEKTAMTRLQTMANHGGSDCENGASRRRVLQAGFATIAAGAFSGTFDALAQSQDQREAVQGIRPIDIHAHYFPETFLNLIAEEGTRFKAVYRRAEKGFFVETPVWSG